ncbi:hypothetical protein IscW_ISCW019518 [Ixodes scapularis]|uniref:Uncharacterized protein n=1 Tax=Ixodes scapularis TaxID=6945 RepID=B7PWC3_IXOSC|nr:hypothetical protein IscW_ISCW019518 [Ixodes scapularis]|eukprot:XP_002409667.1 hypothetical protein IscW_ISCW019518 [Ixodes scapularis]
MFCNCRHFNSSNYVSCTKAKKKQKKKTTNYLRKVTHSYHKLLWLTAHKTNFPHGSVHDRHPPARPDDQDERLQLHQVPPRRGGHGRGTPHPRPPRHLLHVPRRNPSVRRCIHWRASSFGVAKPFGTRLCKDSAMECLGQVPHSPHARSAKHIRQSRQPDTTRSCS